MQLLVYGCSIDDDHRFQFQIRLDGIPISWILLDIQITVNKLPNGSLLKNIREGERNMNVCRNAGVYQTNLIGDINSYPKPIWYYPKGIINILSIARVKKNPNRLQKINFFIVHKYRETGIYFSYRNRSSTTCIQHNPPSQKTRGKDKEQEWKEIPHTYHKEKK